MPTIRWSEHGEVRESRWHSETGAPAPAEVVVIGAETTADQALRLVRAGTGLLWRGDYHAARQLLTAMGRRLDRGAGGKGSGRRGGGKRGPRGQDARGGGGGSGRSAAQESGRRGGGAVVAASASAEASGAGVTASLAAAAFTAQRESRAERAQLLARLIVEIEPDWYLDMRRAPDIAEACELAYGDVFAGDGSERRATAEPGFENEPRPGTVVGSEADCESAPAQSMCVALTELQGVLGSYGWYQRGVEIPALGDRIHPHYGVFSPIRGEYIDLVAEAPLSAEVRVAYDLGTGTGVLAAVLARRGVPRIIATDLNPRALACARENAGRLGVGDVIDVVPGDPYPVTDASAGRGGGTDAAAAPHLADLIVCNPPWLPATPTSAVELGVYDEDSAMLRAFLSGLDAHLAPGGEAWLIISDFAEHLGLRTRADLLGLIDQAGMQVVGTHEMTPTHGKAKDASDPLHAARSREITTLWRLGRG